MRLQESPLVFARALVVLNQALRICQIYRVLARRATLLSDLVKIVGRLVKLVGGDGNLCVVALGSDIGFVSVDRLVNVPIQLES